MTLTRAATRPRAALPWAAPAALLCGLGAIVAARWLATRLGLDALLVGAAFGGALLALWLAASPGALRRPSRARARRLPRAVVAGAAVGGALLLVAIAGSSLGGSLLPPGALRPAAPFAAWALVTVLVATAEEGILRGVLLDRIRRAYGTVLALAVTTAAFALLHVPLYGWEIVPLDLAVGLALGGLRLATGTIVAPAVAHAVADLATWWL